MLRHRKLKHIEEVSECLKFQSGDCGFSDAYCWNKHTDIQDNHSRKAKYEGEIETNQDFHEVQKIWLHQKTQTKTQAIWKVWQKKNK